MLILPGKRPPAAKSATRLRRSRSRSAIAALLNRNLLVVEIREKIAKKGQTKGGKVALADLVVFTRQLATMIDAGIPIVQVLQALAEQTPNKIMRDTVHDICTRVESGESFSEALTRHPKAFNRLYVAMVSAPVKRAGCSRKFSPAWRPTWKIPNDLRKKVKTALMYPTVVTHRGDRHHHLFAGARDSDFQGSVFRFRREIARPRPRS